MNKYWFYHNAWIKFCVCCFEQNDMFLRILNQILKNLVPQIALSEPHHKKVHPSKGKKIAFARYSVWTSFRMKYLRTSFHLALSVISNDWRLALRQAKYVSWIKPKKQRFNLAVLSVCNLCVISTTCHFFGHVIATSLTVFFRSASLLNFTTYRSLRFTSLYVNSTFCSVGAICAKLTKMLIEHFVHSAPKLHAKLTIVKMVRQQTFECLGTIVISMAIRNSNL